MVNAVLRKCLLGGQVRVHRCMGGPGAQAQGVGLRRLQCGSLQLGEVLETVPAQSSWRTTLAAPPTAVHYVHRR